MGGATANVKAYLVSEEGLSPRGRGNPSHPQFALCSSGSIPAWAGQPQSGPAGGRGARVYPRVGGATNEGDIYVQ